MISMLNKTLSRAFRGSMHLVRSRSQATAAVGQCSTSATAERSDLVVPKEEVLRFIKQCMCKVGTPEENAEAVAEHLFTADYRGHFSHGMNRMQMYVKDIQNGLTDGLAQPEVVNDFQAIALVDGKNGLGQVVGKFCMELAMEKAKSFGIGMVSAKGSNHYGIAGFYTLMAVERGLIGFSCTNTSPLMAPTRSRKAGLGTNPLSLGARASGGDQFVLDMATTAVALGKIELSIRKEQDIPEGWAQDPDGQVTTDSKLAFETACLMPLGGAEKNSGFKGYGLGLMVEILCGVLSGSHFGPNVRSWQNATAVADLGHCFMAIDPEKFAAGSEERLARLLKQLRELPTVGDDAVLVAGDPERAAMRKVDEAGGVTYHENQLKASAEFAKLMDVQPMKMVPKRK